MKSHVKPWLRFLSHFSSIGPSRESMTSNIFREQTSAAVLVLPRADAAKIGREKKIGTSPKQTSATRVSPQYGRVSSPHDIISCYSFGKEPKYSSGVRSWQHDWLKNTDCSHSRYLLVVAWYLLRYRVRLLQRTATQGGAVYHLVDSWRHGRLHLPFQT